MRALSPCSTTLIRPMLCKSEVQPHSKAWETNHIISLLNATSTYMTNQPPDGATTRRFLITFVISYLSPASSIPSVNTLTHLQLQLNKHSPWLLLSLPSGEHFLPLRNLHLRSSHPFLQDSLGLFEPLPQSWAFIILWRKFFLSLQLRLRVYVHVYGSDLYEMARHNALLLLRASHPAPLIHD